MRLLTCCSMLNVAIVSAASMNVTTIAGNGHGQAGFIDGYGDNAQFNSPYGITPDHSSKYYFITDLLNNAIRKISVVGDYVSTIKLSLSLNLPWASCIDSTNSYLYVTESGYTSHIRRISLSTGVVTNASIMMFENPNGIAIDPTDSFLYVTDAINNVNQINIATGFSTIVAGNSTGGYMDSKIPTSAMFNGPANLCVDPTGHSLFIADSGNNNIRKIVFSPFSVTTLVGSMTLVGSATAPTSGMMDGVGSAALFNNPNGITINPAGTILYAADSGNNNIRRINIATKMVTTIAGSATGLAGNKDGAGTNSLLNNPYGVAVDPTSQFLLIADSSNNEIKSVVVGVPALSTNSCFAATETIAMESGEVKFISDVKVGDRVLSADVAGKTIYSTVVYVPHGANKEVAMFAHISTETGRDIKMTMNHILPAGVCGSSLPLVYASKVTVGDCVNTITGQERVVSVMTVQSEGVYTVVTNEEYVVVNVSLPLPLGLII